MWYKTFYASQWRAKLTQENQVSNFDEKSWSKSLEEWKGNRGKNENYLI